MTRVLLLMTSVGLGLLACSSPTAKQNASRPPPTAGAPAPAGTNAMVAGRMALPPPRAGSAASAGSMAGSPVAQAGAPSVSNMPPSPTVPGMPPAPVAGAMAMPPVGAATDPGTEPWVVVPPEQLGAVCKLDLAALRQAESELEGNRSFAVVRYGKLCFRSKNDGMAEVFSTTKTLGAVMVGRAMYETRMIPKAGEKTGPLDEFQRVDAWLDSFSFHKDATIAHVLGMEAHNMSLAYGQKKHSYDAGGNVQINRLVEVVRTAIAQDATRLAGGDTTMFMQRFVFDKLGMKQSRWATPTIIAISWNTLLDDMARLGLLILNGGVWSGERLLSTQYVYNMTHASFEDGSADYGYLTWLLPPACTPRAIHRKYPHGPVSMAPNCGQPSCTQKYDVGIWYAGGLGGQFIMGHRGLDMVIVGKNWGEGRTDLLWNAVRPAVVALDATYKGNDQAFCQAYARGDYAPDLKPWEGGI